MDIAKSIYKGGIIVYADDDFIDYYSYLELGLTCPACHEEVYLRKGQVRRKHFAHFHAVSERHKSCEYRVKAFSKSLGGNFTIESREQRRKIFQAYLIDFIACSYGDFYEKSEKPQPSSYSDFFVQNCVKKYNHQKDDFIFRCRLLQKEKFSANDIAHKLVAGEVFCYLGADSSIPVLKKLIFYSISKITEESEVNNFDDALEVKIVAYVESVILGTSWDLLYESISLSRLESILKDRVYMSVSLFQRELQKEIDKQREKSVQLNHTISWMESVKESEDEKKEREKRREEAEKRKKEAEKRKEEKRALNEIRGTHRAIIRQKILDDLKEKGMTEDFFEDEAREELYYQIEEICQMSLKFNDGSVECPYCHNRMKSGLFNHVKSHKFLKRAIQLRRKKKFNKYISHIVESELLLTLQKLDNGSNI